MKEKKVRQKGFLAMLLVAIIVLGMPGMTVLANSYHVNDIHSGMTLQTGDSVYTNIVLNSGNELSVLDDSLNELAYDHALADEDRILYIDIPFGYWLVTNTFFNDYYYYIYVTSNNAPSNDSPAEGYFQSIRELIALINLPGGDTHRFSTGTALTYDILKSLEDNPEDTLIFTTEYKGYRYSYTIHGYDVKGKIKPEIPWYGPYWLAQNFFETTVIEPLEPITPIQ